MVRRRLFVLSGVLLGWFSVAQADPIEVSNWRNMNVPVGDWGEMKAGLKMPFGRSDSPLSSDQGGDGSLSPADDLLQGEVSLKLAAKRFQIGRGLGLSGRFGMIAANGSPFEVDSQLVRYSREGALDPSKRFSLLENRAFIHDASVTVDSEEFRLFGQNGTASLTAGLQTWNFGFDFAGSNDLFPTPAVRLDTRWGEAISGSGEGGPVRRQTQLSVLWARFPSDTFANNPQVRMFQPAIQLTGEQRMRYRVFQARHSLFISPKPKDREEGTAPLPPKYMDEYLGAFLNKHADEVFLDITYKNPGIFLGKDLATVLTLKLAGDDDSRLRPRFWRLLYHDQLAKYNGADASDAWLWLLSGDLVERGRWKLSGEWAKSGGGYQADYVSGFFPFGVSYEDVLFQRRTIVGAPMLVSNLDANQPNVNEQQKYQQLTSGWGLDLRYDLTRYDLSDLSPPPQKTARKAPWSSSYLRARYYTGERPFADETWDLGRVAYLSWTKKGVTSWRSRSDTRIAIDAQISLGHFWPGARADYYNYNAGVGRPMNEQVRGFSMFEIALMTDDLGEVLRDITKDMKRSAATAKEQPASGG